MQQFRFASHSQVALQPEDDVDKLFNHLGQLEAPGELIARILAHIGRLPRPSASSSLVSELAGSEESASLIVRNEWHDPS